MTTKSTRNVLKNLKLGSRYINVRFRAHPRRRSRGRVSREKGPESDQFGPQTEDPRPFVPKISDQNELHWEIFSCLRSRDRLWLAEKIPPPDVFEYAPQSPIADSCLVPPVTGV